MVRPDDPEDDIPSASGGIVMPPAMVTAAVLVTAEQAAEDSGHLSSSSLHTESVADEEELILLQQERGELGAGVDESADLTQMLLLQGQRAAAATAAAVGGSSGDSAAAASPVTPAVMSASPNEASQSVGINTVSSVTAIGSELTAALPALHLPITTPPSQTSPLDSSGTLPSPSHSTTRAAASVGHVSTASPGPDTPSLLQLQLLEIANSNTNTPPPTTKTTTQVAPVSNTASIHLERAQLVDSIATDLVDAAFKEAVVSMVAVAGGREDGPVVVTTGAGAAVDTASAVVPISVDTASSIAARDSSADSLTVNKLAQHLNSAGSSLHASPPVIVDGESESLEYDEFDLGSSVISIGGDSDKEGQEDGSSDAAAAVLPPPPVSLLSWPPEPAADSRESSYEDERFDEEDSSFPDALLLLDSEGGGGEEIEDGEGSGDMAWGLDQLISPVLDQAIMAAQAGPSAGEREGAGGELLREESSSSTGGPRRSSVPGMVCTHEASRAYVEEVMTRFLGEPPEVSLLIGAETKLVINVKKSEGM